MMKSTSTNLKVSLDGDSLFVKTFGEDDFDIHLIFFHDIGEYHERYLELIEFLYSSRVSVTAIDLRGHGLSNGIRGMVPSLEVLRNDNIAFKKLIDSIFPKQSKIISGHGVGALIALDFFTNHYPFAGMFLIEPAIKIKYEILDNVENILSKWNFLKKIKVPWILEKKNRDFDPLVNQNVSLGTLGLISDLSNKTKSNIYYVNKPTMVVINEANSFFDNVSSHLLVKSIRKEDLYIYSMNDKIIKYKNTNLSEKILTWITENFRR